jgi:hypothetical protein
MSQREREEKRDMTSRGRLDGTKERRMFGRQCDKWEGMAASNDGGIKWNWGAIASRIRFIGNKTSAMKNPEQDRHLYTSSFALSRSLLRCPAVLPSTAFDSFYLSLGHPRRLPFGRYGLASWLARDPSVSSKKKKWSKGKVKDKANNAVMVDKPT